MRLDEICDLQNKNIEDNCFRVEKGKTKAAVRDIPVHPLVQPIIDKLKDSAKDEYLIRAINSVGYDNKRSIDSVLVEVTGFEAATPKSL